MRKFLAIFASLVLVLGFAVSAFAIHAEIPSETQAAVAKGTTQITLGGELRVRGWYLDNASGNRRAVSTPADTAGETQGWYDQRVRLSMQADVSKNTTGFVQLETAGENSSTTDGITWGTTGGGLNGKHTEDLSILEAWILHKGSGLLGIPAGIKVGHMPLALGERQFLDHTKFGDDAIVFFMDPTKELHIGLLTAKLVEATAANSSAADANAYVALATYKINKDNTLGINYTYINDSGVAIATVGQKFSFQNLGIHANGTIAGLKYALEYDKQFGNFNDSGKFKGYGFFLNLGYKIDPVNIRVGYAQGSGDAGNADVNKNKDFQVTAGNDVHYTFIYEYTTRDASSNRDLAQATRSNGISNTTYYRLGFDYSPMKDLNLSLDGFILKATKVASGSKNIGNEYDLKIAYKIDRNLVYFITAGILDPGKWWVDTAGVTSANNKNIKQAVHGITLSF